MLFHMRFLLMMHIISVRERQAVLLQKKHEMIQLLCQCLCFSAQEIICQVTLDCYLLMILSFLTTKSSFDEDSCSSCSLFQLVNDFFYMNSLSSFYNCFLYLT